MIDLRAPHRELRGRHGPQGWWWAGEDPFEIAVGAMLVRRCRWEQAAAAIAALRAAEPLGIEGVGEETADAISTYSVARAAFLRDEYARRVLTAPGSPAPSAA